MQTKVDEYRSSRILYLIVAAIDYFIAIITTSTYLAKLTTSLGIPDGTIGVINSFVSIAAAFNLVSLFISPTVRAKKIVVTSFTISYFCYVFLYFTPFLKISPDVRTAIFAVLFLVACIMTNISFSPKIVWSRGLIERENLGKFTATVEIISLVAGMGFMLVTGALIDYLEAQNKLYTAFIIFGCIIFALGVSSITIWSLIKEKKVEVTETVSTVQRIKAAITDRATLTIMPMFMIWYIAIYLTTPFFGTYQINDLGFSMTVISLLSTGYSLLRALISRPLGKFADKHSFSHTLVIGMLAFALGLFILALGGRVAFIIYFMLYAVTLAGTNASLMNIIYVCVPAEKRVGAMAVIYTAAGTVGFVTTLLAKPLVDKIQANGNTFLGIEGVYAQQVLSVLGAIVTLICIAYVILTVRKLPRKDGKSTDNTKA